MPVLDFLLNDDDGLLTQLAGEPGNGQHNVLDAYTNFLLTGSANAGEFIANSLLTSIPRDGLGEVLAATLSNTLDGGDGDGDLLVEELIDDITGGKLDAHDLGNLGGLLNDTTDLLFG